MIFLIMLSVILSFMFMMLVLTLDSVKFLVCDNSLSWFLNLNLTYEPQYAGVGSDWLISVFVLVNLITEATDCHRY